MSKNKEQDVPEQIFTNFIKRINETGISEEICKKLEDTLLNKKEYKEDSLRKAMFD